MESILSISDRVKSWSKRAIPFVGWLAVWEVFALTGLLKRVLVPTPGDVARTMFSFSFLSSNGANVISTVGWSIGAWLLSIGLALFLAGVGTRLSILSHILSPVVIVGRSLPSVIAVPVFAGALGQTRRSAFVCAIYICTCYSIPVLEVAWNTIGSSLTRIEQAVRLNSVQRVIFVIGPSLGLALRGIAAQSLGLALVITVAAEMILLIRQTAGAEVYEAYGLLNYREVYAVVAWLMVGAVLLNAILGPLPLIALIPGRRLAKHLDAKIKDEPQ